MEISQKRFNQILQEEVSRFHKIQQLEKEKEKILSELNSINSENLDEGLGKVLGGLKGVWNGISKSYNSGQAEFVKKQAEAEKARLQAQITRIWNQIKFLHKSYKSLTGKDFNPKAVAGPVQYKKPVQPQATMNAPVKPIKRVRQSVTSQPAVAA